MAFEPDTPTAEDWIGIRSGPGAAALAGVQLQLDVYAPALPQIPLLEGDSPHYQLRSEAPAVAGAFQSRRRGRKLSTTLNTLKVVRSSLEGRCSSAIADMRARDEAENAPAAGQIGLRPSWSRARAGVRARHVRDHANGYAASRRGARRRRSDLNRRIQRRPRACPRQTAGTSHRGVEKSSSRRSRKSVPNARRRVRGFWARASLYFGRHCRRCSQSGRAAA